MADKGLGLHIGNECRELFHGMKFCKGPKHTWMVLTIHNECEVQKLKAGQGRDVCEEICGAVTQDQCAYIIADVPQENASTTMMCMVLWTPDGGDSKSKFMYASGFNRVRNLLPGADKKDRQCSSIPELKAELEKISKEK